MTVGGTETSSLSKARLAQEDIHEQWESDYLNPEVDRFYDAAFDRIIENLDNAPDKTILDIGCGYCYHTKRLGRSKLAITALDFSPVALAHAEQNLIGSGIEDRVTLKQGDATALPFGDATFDNVLIWGVLMHIPEVEKALSEAARVLKPGGKLVITENNDRSLEVAMLEPLINLTKHAIGRKPHERRKAPLGIEEWQPAETGALMVRKMDVAALQAFYAKLGLRLEKRFAGQFTELYARLPSRLMKRLIHAFNRAYFKSNGPAGPAFGNILIFVKDPA